jgi:hypothetical protein
VSEPPVANEITAPSIGGAVAIPKTTRIELPALDPNKIDRTFQGDLVPESDFMERLPSYNGRTSTDTLANALKRGNVQSELGTASYQLSTDKNNPKLQARVKQLEAQLGQMPQADPNATLLQKGLTGFTEMLPMQGKALLAGALGAGAGAAVGAVTGPGSLVTAGLGATAGAAKYMNDLEKGFSYRDMIKTGVDPTTADVTSSIVGTVNGLIEMVELGQFGKAIVKGIPGASRLLKEAGQEATESLLKTALRYPQFVATQAGEEAAQQFVTSAGEELAKAITNRVNGSDLPTDAKKPFLDAVDEFVNTIPTFAVSGFLPHVGQMANVASQGKVVSDGRVLEPDEVTGPTPQLNSGINFTMQDPIDIPSVIYAGGREAIQLPAPVSVEQEIGQKLGAMVEEYVIKPRVESQNSPVAPSLPLAPTSVSLPQIGTLEGQRQRPVEVPNIVADTMMPAAQIEAPQIERVSEVKTPIVPEVATNRRTNVSAPQIAIREVAAIAERDLLPKITQPAEAQVKAKAREIKRKREKLEQVKFSNREQLEEFDAMVSELQSERDTYERKLVGEVKGIRSEGDILTRLKRMNVKRPDPKDVFLRDEFNNGLTTYQKSFFRSDDSDGVTFHEAATEMGMSPEQLWSEVANARAEKPTYRAVDDGVIAEYDRQINELKSQRQGYEEQFQAEETKAASVIEQQVKELEAAAKGIQNIDLQAFAKQYLKRHRELLTELKEKGISKRNMAEVRKLIGLTDVVAEMKREHRMELQKAKAAGREAERERLLPKLDKAKQGAKTKVAEVRRVERNRAKMRLATARKEAAARVTRARQRGAERLNRFKEETRLAGVFDKLLKREKTVKRKLLQSLRLLRKAYRKLGPDVRKEAGNILDLFDYRAGKMLSQTKLGLEQLQAFVEAQKKIDPSYVVPPQIESKLKRLGKRSITDMTIADVKDLQDVIDHILFKDTQAKQMIGLEQAQTIADAQDKSVAEVNAKIGEEKVRSIPRDMLDFFRLQAVSPRVLAQRMANWGKKGTIFRYFFEDINAGKRKKRTIDRDAHVAISERLKPVIGEIRGWGNEKKREAVKLPNAGEVKMTKMELMSVYLSSLNADNRRHLQESGGTVRGSQIPIKFTDRDFAEIKRMVESNPVMKRVAEAYQYVFDVILKKAINETSMVLDGYEKAQVEHYFPIITNKDFEDTQQGSTARYRATLEGAGYLKERSGGLNAVRIEDASKAVERAIETVSSYYGYSAPIRNARAILGHGEFKQAIKAKFGQPVLTYWSKLFDQLEGNRLPLDTFEQGTNRLTANYAQAVLGANPSIVLQQFSSLPKAWAFVGIKHLAKGTASKADWEIIERFSPEIWKRRQGYVYREAGEIAEIKQASPWLKMIEFADSTVIGSIWNAVESEVKEKSPGLSGDAFYEKVALRVEEIIDRSQQTAEPINRSAISRSESAWSRLTFAFTTEANATYNMLYEAFGNRKNDGKYLLRTVSAFFASALASAAMRMVIHKWRGRDDEEWGKELISALLSPVYFAQSIYDFFSSNFQFNQGNLAESVVGDLLRSVKSLTSDKLTVNGKAAEVIGAIAQLGGIPSNNVSREFETALGRLSPSIAYEYRKMFRIYSTGEMKGLAVKEATRKPSSDLLRELTIDMRRAGVTSGEMSSYLRSKATAAKKKGDTAEERKYENLVPVLAPMLPKK